MPDDSVIKKFQTVRNDYISKFFVNKFGTIVMLPYKPEETLTIAISTLVHRSGLNNTQFTLTDGKNILDPAKSLKDLGILKSATIFMNIDEDITIPRKMS